MGFFKNVCCNIRGYRIRKSKHPEAYTGVPKKLIAGVMAGVLIICGSGGAVLAHHFAGNEEEVSTDEFAAFMLKPPAMNFDFYEPTYVEIPNFVGMSIASDSLEKDLTIYFKGAETKSRIEGVSFQVKLIDPKNQKYLDEYLTAIDDLNDQIDAAKEDGSENDKYVASNEKTSETKVAGASKNKGTLTAAENKADEKIQEQKAAAEETIQANFDELTVGEKLLLDKQVAIQSYATALNAVEGDNYMDDDGDGMIYINKIDAGKYVACMIPTGYYDPADYATEVTVKDKVEYKKVENIQEKVKDASKVEDEKPAEAAQVEAVMTDTVSAPAQVTEVKEGEAVTAAPLSPSVGAGTTVETEFTKTARRQTNRFVASVQQIMAMSVVHATEGDGTGTSQTTEPSTNENPSETPSTDPGTGEGGTTPEPQPTTTSEKASLTVPSTATIYAAGGINTVTGDVASTNVASITVASSDANVSAEVANGKVVITGSTTAASDVTATLTYTAICADGVTAFTANTTVTLVGTSTPLKSADGKELYVDKDCKTAATLANYGGTVYANTGKVTYQGTGWVEKDGKKYYVNNGTIVTGDQVIGGVQYSFNGNGVLVPKEGIDVSKWQGNIDWATASCYINFAVIRCGYRGESSRGLAIDPKFSQNVSGAKANGVKIGLYFYSTAMSEAEAVEEASLAVQCAQQAGGLSLPIYIDMEAGCQSTLSNEQRTAICNAFCATVRNSGYSAGVYANKNWLTNYINTGAISGAEIWVAQYNTTCTYGGSKKMWQYTSKGSVPGISGNVDMNRRY